MLNLKTKKMEASNKLIAEFMGLETPFNEISDATLYTYKGIEEASAITFVVDVELHEMRYHLSWDWLMPVVQKCYKIDNEEGFNNLVDAVSTLNLNGTYQAVVEFIKTYNDER